MDIPVDLGTIRLAAERITPFAVRTPVLSSQSLNNATGSNVYLKCENFQKVGAFKFRGALNAILTLEPEQKSRGVITHSSGNHGQALARAGQLFGIPVCVVMPNTAPMVKRKATESFGARVVLCEPTLVERETTVRSLIEESGYELIHPFNDWRVIAGQGTAVMELLDQTENLDAVITPVGGGGLISGTALAVKALQPEIQVIGAEPARADDAMRSLISGQIESSGDPKTVADGLRTSLGDKNFEVIRKNVDRIVTATEEEILTAMQFVWERFKIIIEPSCAVAVAPLMFNKLPELQGKNVGVIITGGNLDLEPLFESLRNRFIDS